jgi:hypothetical protein
MPYTLLSDDPTVFCEIYIDNLGSIRDISVSNRDVKQGYKHLKKAVTQLG